jgi:hypothetical protein
LLTGVRTEGFPAALYLSGASTKLEKSLDTSAAMPVGDAATAGGTVSKAWLTAWMDGRGWAPAGKAFLVVNIDDWTANAPCCELSDVTTIPLFSLVPSTGDRVDALAPGEPARPERVFEVPADFTKGNLELRLLVTFHREGREQSALGDPVRVAIDLPS